MAGTRGAIAAGHPLTVEVAGSILREGGNAFDAALGALCCACVVEPVLASLGGGGFMLASSPRHGDHLYDFFVQTPKRKREPAEIDFYPVTVNFGAAAQEFHIGNGAVATPGLVRGLFDIHADLGRMPMIEVVQPAIDIARHGSALNELQAYILDLVSPIFTATESARALYTHDGTPETLLRAGDPLRNPVWADLLEALAREGDRLFYEGEIAALIIDQAHGEGGQLQADDLAGYQVVRREPLAGELNGYRILTNPPPSSGGALILFALQMLADTDLAALGFGSDAYWRVLARAMAATTKARVDGLLDGDAHAALLDAKLLRRYRTDVSGRAQALRGTTHINVMDGEGNVAALSVSNGEGCGQLLPGTGMMLNNMLGEDDLNPQGFHAWPCDSRMTSMMAPSLVRAPDDNLCFALGSGGSNRIRSAILQVLINLLVFEQDLEPAVNAPRMHLEGDVLDLEEGDPQALPGLRSDWPRHKIWNTHNMFFGGVHCAARQGQRLSGAGDRRRGGVSAVV